MQPLKDPTVSRTFCVPAFSIALFTFVFSLAAIGFVTVSLHFFICLAVALAARGAVSRAVAHVLLVRRGGGAGGRPRGAHALHAPRPAPQVLARL